MINSQTRLKVSDNSGGIIAKCIKGARSKRKPTALIGDLILITLVKKKKKKKLKKRIIYYGLIIMISKFICRVDGTFVKFNDNRVLLLSRSSRKFLGSRIYGINLKEFKWQLAHDEKKNQMYKKLLSYSKFIV